MLSEHSKDRFFTTIKKRQKLEKQISQFEKKLFDTDLCKEAQEIFIKAIQDLYKEKEETEAAIQLLIKTNYERELIPKVLAKRSSSYDNDWTTRLSTD